MKSAKKLAILVLGVGLMVCSGQRAFAGSIVGWGDNTWGQLNNIPTGDDHVAIAAGKIHNLALKSDGSIVGWGDNYYNQATPPAGNDFVAIATGEYYSLALKSDGSIVGWGQSSSPPAGSGYLAIAAGHYHRLAIKSDGSIVAWGDNSHGQLNNIPAGNDFVAVTGGSRHSLALKSDGSIVGWGENAYGQATPPAGNDYVKIAAGAYHNVALKSDGSIVCWGNNNYQQLNGTPTSSDFVGIGVGDTHSLGIKSDGSIVIWGNNDYGQLNGTPAGNDFVAATGGSTYSLALTADPMSTSFIYQGRLIDDNEVAEGLYDFEFKLYNSSGAGSQRGSTVTREQIDVIDGYFTAELDFGSGIFDGNDRWLEIGVRPGELSEPNLYTTLSPRQKITPAPYAVYAKTAGGTPLGISGIGSADYIPKFTDADTLADSIICENIGRIGIGITAPDSKLEVDGTIHSSSGGFRFPDGTMQMTAVEQALASVDGVEGDGGGNVDFVEGDNITITPNPGDNSVTFSPSADGYSLDAADGAPIDAVYVDDDGKVGIGTASPGAVLDVNGPARATRLQDRENTSYYVDPGGSVSAALNGRVGIGGAPYSGIGGFGPDLHVNTGQDTAKVWFGGSQTAVGAELAHLSFTGSSTSGMVGPASYAGIAAEIVGSGSGLTPPRGNMLFYTATGIPPMGDPYEERMRITYNGKVGIGTDSPTQARLVVWPKSGEGGIFIRSTTYSEIEMDTGTANIYSNGHFYLGSKTDSDLYFVTQSVTGTKMTIKNNGNVGIGTMNPGSYKLAVYGSAAKPGGGSWSDFSDIRLKDINGNYEPGLEEIAKLKPIRYNYKQDNSLGLPAEKEFVGVISQDIQGVIPAAVEENDDGYLLVNNDPVIWAMVNAIKELKAENDSLKQRLETLERAIQQRQFVSAKEVQ